MASEKYLYGAAVQGIQSFIFQTNELNDIIGASELVNSICKEEFDKYGDDSDSVLRAAGNIKHIFNSEADCRRAVLEFPKRVMTIAPGITISQAVVKMEGVYESFAAAVDELEKRLRIQRNIPTSSVGIGQMGVKRSPKTGYPVVACVDGEYLDAATFKKRSYKPQKELCAKAFPMEVADKPFASDLRDMTSKNDWIAIIHADGNGLGQVVRKVGKAEKDFRNFSQRLDDVTSKAAQEAWTQVQDMVDDCSVIPLRPVVLGGDDLTVICRADFAIEYATAFLRCFEEQSERQLGDILERYEVFGDGEKRLTACAGVAFVKSSYPFSYGYELAESLCGEAKKHAKRLKRAIAPSCLMFHKVQDCFVESFSQIEKRELTIGGDISFRYGPYYICGDDKKLPSVAHLLDVVRQLGSEDGNKVKSHLRQWISALYDSVEFARQKRSRVLSLLHDGELEQLFGELTHMSDQAPAPRRSMAYDVLSLASVKYQVTKQ